MKTIQKITLLALSVLTLETQAQTAANDTMATRDITVERQFTPIVQAADRIAATPKLYTTTLTPKPVSYTLFQKNMAPELTIKSLPAADVHFPKPDVYNGFARAGLGLCWNTLGDFGYKLINTDDAALDLQLHHLGTFAKRKLSQSTGDLNFSKKLDDITLYGGIGASHEWFNYYGRYYDGNTAQYDWDAAKADTAYTNRIWDMVTRFGVQSAEDADVSFQAQIGYEMTNIKHPLTEHRMHALGGAAWEAGDGHIGFKADMQTIFYAAKQDSALHAKPFCILKLMPYYSLIGERAWVQAGINLDMCFGHGRGFAPSPNVSAEWQVVPNMMALYGRLTGEYSVNTLQTAMTENRYLQPTLQITDTLSAYTPVDFQFGIKVKPQESLQLNIYGQYKYTIDQYYYVADMAGTFAALHANTSLFKIGMAANYHYRDRVNVMLGANYNNWKAKQQAYAWDKPAFEAQLAAQVRITPKIAVQADTYFASKRFACVETVAATLESKKLNAIYDINIGATYTPNSWLSFFANLNNLANNKHEQFYGYQVEGINFVLGAAVQF